MGIEHGQRNSKRSLFYPYMDGMVPSRITETVKTWKDVNPERCLLYAYPQIPQYTSRELCPVNRIDHSPDDNGRKKFKLGHHSKLQPIALFPQDNMTSIIK